MLAVVTTTPPCDSVTGSASAARAVPLRPERRLRRAGARRRPRTRRHRTVRPCPQPAGTARSAVAISTSSSSPASWPRLSLITLKRSTSRNSTATSPGLRARRSSAWPRRSRRSVRFGSPVSGSWNAWCSSRSSASERSTATAASAAIRSTIATSTRSGGRSSALWTVITPSRLVSDARIGTHQRSGASLPAVTATASRSVPAGSVNRRAQAPSLSCVSAAVRRSVSVARNGAPCAIPSRARVAAASRTAVRLCSVMSRKLLTKPSMFGSWSRFVDVASSQRHPPSAWLACASATTVRPGPPATSRPSAATVARSSGCAKSNMVLPRRSSGLRPRSRTTDGLTYTKRPCSLLTVIASLAWARNARNWISRCDDLVVGVVARADEPDQPPTDEARDRDAERAEDHRAVGTVHPDVEGDHHRNREQRDGEDQHARAVEALAPREHGIRDLSHRGMQERRGEERVGGRPERVEPQRAVQHPERREPRVHDVADRGREQACDEERHRRVPSRQREQRVRDRDEQDAVEERIGDGRDLVERRSVRRVDRRTDDELPERSGDDERHHGAVDEGVAARGTPPRRARRGRGR